MAINATGIAVTPDSTPVPSNEQYRKAISAVLAIHMPVHSKYRKVPYCSCNSLVSFIASDGYPSTGTTDYPCATVLAIEEALGGRPDAMVAMNVPEEGVEEV